LEEIIEENEKIFRANYGEDVPIENHPLIRSAEGCYQSKRAIAIAEKYKARLHILHLTTETETTCSETIYLLAKRILPLRYRFKIFGFLIKTISAWEH
jgi:hypothetical protein